MYWKSPRTAITLAAAGVLAGALLLALPAQADPVTPVPGDPLTGTGAVSRTVLTAAQLGSGTATDTVDDGAFALPANAAPPAHTFEGRLDLTGESTGGGFRELRDDYSYTSGFNSPRKHLPEVSVELVQNGSHLVPATQGLVITGNSVWNIIYGPGRAWRENGDGGRSRAALPFALVQRNANCTHNGTLTFLFDASSVSQVRYQITQETCQYFKFDLWGQLSATYTPYAVAASTTKKTAHAAEVAGRLPTRPISALATDYPASGINPSVFGSGITAEHMSTYGLLYNGVNYVSGCTTRRGNYPFCESLRVPSYSTAKSAFAGVAYLRLAQRYGTGVANELIRDHFDTSGARGSWTSVNLNHTLDMTTGNYSSSSYMTDEDGTNMSNFFTAEPASTKRSYALNYRNQATPGTQWVYHSSDTYLATQAMQDLLADNGGGADLFAMVRDDVYLPAGLSAGALTTLRTDNSATGRPFGGYGLFYSRDDVAKLARLLNNDGGAAGGVQRLQPQLLAASMQRDPADRGVLTTSTAGFRYNNGFWGRQFGAADGYACSFWVPFMSGYGGITIAMMPNGATYYYFSDNGEFSWAPSVNEAHKLSPHC